MGQIYYAESATPLADVNFLAGDTGGNVGPNTNGVINVHGSPTAWVKGTPGSNLLEVFGSPSYLVDKGGNAPYTTIQAAITQAQTDSVSNTNQKYIVIKPASSAYAENLTISSPGIVLVSWDRYQTERGVGPNSSLRVSGVLLAGTIATSANTKIIGLGIQPADGSTAFNITAFCTLQTVDCKFLMTNAALFTVASSPFIFCSRCVATYTGTSTIDKLVSTASASTVALFADDCNFDLQTATAVTGTYSFSNSYVGTFFNFASSNTSTFTIRNSDCYSGLSSAFITGTASDIVKIESTNSSLRTDGTNLLNITNTSSFVHAQNCYLRGNRTTGTAEVALVSCAGWNATTGVWEPINQSFGNAINRILQQTGTASVQDQIICSSTAGDPSTLWAIDATRGYCMGIQNGSNDACVFTLANSSSLSPETGTQIWKLDPTNQNATTWSLPLISVGGVVSVSTSTTPYNATIADCYIAMDATAAVKTVNLPNAPPNGSVFFVKDSKGQAATHNITVTTLSGTVPFDGVFLDILNIAYAQRKYTYVNSTLGYMIG